MDVISGLHVMKLVRVVKKMKKNEIKHKIEIKQLRKRMLDQTAMIQMLFQSVSDLQRKFGVESSFTTALQFIVKCCFLKCGFNV